MSTPIDEGVNTSETGDETHSLTGREPGEVNNASSRLGTPVTSEEVDRQMKAATNPLTRQLERLCDPKRDEKTSGLIQGPLSALISKFNNWLRRGHRNSQQVAWGTNFLLKNSKFFR